MLTFNRRQTSLKRFLLGAATTLTTNAQQMLGGSVEISNKKDKAGDLFSEFSFTIMYVEGDKIRTTFPEELEFTVPNFFFEVDTCHWYDGDNRKRIMPCSKLANSNTIEFDVPAGVSMGVLTYELGPWLNPLVSKTLTGFNIDILDEEDEV